MNATGEQPRVSPQPSRNSHIPAALDVEAVRRDFPALQQLVHGKPLVYLDNAATAQKPQVMLDALQRAYTAECANIHRGVHLLSARATQTYEGVREQVRRFINARSISEIIFVRGTTEAINLVAQSYGGSTLQPGDEVVISALEHHSNIVPWQMVCAQRGAHLRVIPINRAGEIDMQAYAALLGPRTRMVAISHISNALGTVVPVREVIRLAREQKQNIPVLLDGAQAVPHTAVDVQALDCDFYAFSGHKLFGPTGIGVLYGREKLLEAMPPYQGGGDMIATVTFEKTTYNHLPHKFEAGTPAIAQVSGLGAAMEYVHTVGYAAIGAYEAQLLQYATRALQEVRGLTLIGTAAHKAGVLSFVLDTIHPHDIGTVLDQDGVAIRTSHHCAQPIMDFYGVPATARASLAFYNTTAEVDALVAGLRRVQKMFGYHE